jgi:hypothetical protein
MAKSPFDRQFRYPTKKKQAWRQAAYSRPPSASGYVNQGIGNSSHRAAVVSVDS